MYSRVIYTHTTLLFNSRVTVQHTTPVILQSGASVGAKWTTAENISGLYPDRQFFLHGGIMAIGGGWW